MIYDVNCESEILRKKYICESNTVNRAALRFFVEFMICVRSLQTLRFSEV